MTEAYPPEHVEITRVRLLRLGPSVQLLVISASHFPSFHACPALPGDNTSLISSFFHHDLHTRTRLLPSSAKPATSQALSLSLRRFIALASKPHRAARSCLRQAFFVRARCPTFHLTSRGCAASPDNQHHEGAVSHSEIEHILLKDLGWPSRPWCESSARHSLPQSITNNRTFSTLSGADP